MILATVVALAVAASLAFVAGRGVSPLAWISTDRN